MKKSKWLKAMGNINYTNGHLKELLRVVDSTLINATDNNGRTALMLAITAGRDEEIVMMFLDKQPDITIADFEGYTTLHHAVEFCSVAVIARLLDMGCDVHARTKQGATPLLLAAAKASDLGVLELLVAAGADLLAKDYREADIMVKAVSNKKNDLLPYLFEHGIVMSSVAFEGLNVLQHAIKNNMPLETIKKLLNMPLSTSKPKKRKVSKEKVEYEEYKRTIPSAIILASIFCTDPTVIRLLLELGADLEERDPVFGWTPLMHAVVSEQPPEIVSALVANGALIDAQDPEGKTPLMLAAIHNGYATLYQMLLDFHADASITDNDGKTEMDYALDNCSSNFEESIIILDSKDEKSLLQAAEQGDAQAQYRLGNLYLENSRDFEDALKWYRLASAQGFELAEVKLSNLLGDDYDEDDDDEDPDMDDDNIEVIQVLQLAAEQGDAEAQSMLGSIYFIGEEVPRDFTKAAKWFWMAAEQGDADAQFGLGALYEIGEGVSRDYVQAEKFYSLAANQGVAGAQQSLADLYRTGSGVSQNYEEAVKWYRLAAAQGLVSAQKYLGMSYVVGLGIPQDYTEAATWFRKAAEQGDAKAEHYLGILYDDGDGVPQDFIEAGRWYRLAAEQGNADAQNRLGELYWLNYIKSEDETEPVKWFRMAAEQGHADAQRNFGLMYECGHGVPMDCCEAAKWYRLAAEQGQASALNRLGELYLEGHGVSKDYAEAEKWFKMAIDQGDEDAEFNLGRVYCELGNLYEKGEGVHKNLETAITYYRQATDIGVGDAFYKLGYLYENGEGVPRDIKIAIENYNQAAEYFVEEAAEALERLGVPIV